MKKLIYLILFLLFPLCLQAQQAVNKADSLSTAVADSVGQLTSYSDSLQQGINKLQQLSSSVDTLKLKQSLDSIQSLNLPTEIAQVKMDSIRNLLDVSAKANEQIQQLNQKLNQPLQENQQKLQGKVDKLTKLEEVNQEALGNLKEQTGVDINTSLPKVDGVHLDGVEGVNLPTTDLPTGDLSRAELPGVELPKTGLPDIEGLDKVQEGMGKLGEVSDQVDAYSDDVKNISQGKLNEVKNADKLAEDQLMKREELGVFQKQQGEALGGAKEFQQYGKEEYLKQKAVEEATKVAVDHFAGQKDKLDAARAKLLKYKSQYSEVKSIKELPKNPLKRNPLKDKPLKERIILGSIWQFSREERLVMDLGPSIAYRITDKIEAGAAYQWRLQTTADFPFLAASDKLEGYSLFVDYKIKKGFFIRGTYARLNAYPIAHDSQEVQEKRWMSSFEAGIGKSYTFFRSIKGYSLLQYNFSTGFNKPYANPLQMKLGFYINAMDVKKKKE